MKFKKGHKINLGRKHTNKSITSFSIAKIGKKNPMYGKTGKNSPGWKGGKPKCSLCKIELPTYCKVKRCKKCYIKVLSSRNQSKDKHWNWKGGITPLTIKIRNSPKYKKWRSSIFHRDNFTCIICGQRGGRLEVDHYPTMFSTIFHNNKIKSLNDALLCEEFWDINNGRTVCKKHNPRTGRKVKLQKDPIAVENGS